MQILLSLTKLESESRSTFEPNSEKIDNIYRRTEYGT